MKTVKRKTPLLVHLEFSLLCTVTFVLQRHPPISLPTHHLFSHWSYMFNGEKSAPSSEAGRVSHRWFACVCCNTREWTYWCWSRGDRETYGNFSRISFWNKLSLTEKTICAESRAARWMTSAAGNPVTHPIVSLSHCVKIIRAGEG